jgi:tRNA(adenine34) deaminase
LKDKREDTDLFFLKKALEEAKKALKYEEVPVGAVIVKNGRIISRGFNKCIALSDPTAHAEIVSLRKAANKLNNYRLNNCEIYVTVEPCAMCAGALINARVKRIIFGALDKKAGACRSVFKIADGKKLNHKIKISHVAATLVSTECAQIIKDFFKSRRSFCKRNSSADQ